MRIAGRAGRRPQIASRRPASVSPITGTGESRHVAAVAALMIRAPPTSGQRPGDSWWTSQAQSGLRAGSARRSSDAAAAGTCRRPRESSK